MDFFLTEDEKRGEIERLRWSDLDPGIFELVKALNELPGIVILPLQSCQGRVKRSGSQEPGCLWLRLSGNAFRRFEQRVHELLGCRLIERVQVIYFREGPVVDITFRGMNKGKEALEASCAFLLAFFSSIQGW